MRLPPRSKARRSCEALEAAGRAMAALDANPLHQRMMARTRDFWGLPESEQSTTERP